MTPAEISLLRSVMNPADQLRAIGDAPLAKSLQSQGMATVVYLEEMTRIRVEPTPKGRRFFIAVLNNARSSAEPTHRAAPPRAVE